MSPRSSGSTAFPNCESEPIHLIGQIQPHGVLLAVDPDSQRIAYVSDNAEGLLGKPTEELLGAPLDTLVDGRDLATLLSRRIEPRMPHLSKPFHCRIKSGGKGKSGLVLSCCAHRLDDHLILELEKPDTDRVLDERTQDIRDYVIEKLAKPEELGDLLQDAAEFLRYITGYDRVMVYRFHPDHHGEVVAESTHLEERFLGLHYPEADIPPPARRHYLINLVRLICDIEAPPANLLASEKDAEPLDLSYSKLRGVAPVHVSYMANMGVRGSMSLSLIVDGKLWGLLACHHYGPKFLAPAVVHVCEVTAELISAFIDRILKSDRLEGMLAAEAVCDRLDDAFYDGNSVVDAVEREAGSLRELFDASFLVASIGGDTVVEGDAPAHLPEFETLREHAGQDPLLSDHLVSLLPEGARADALCAGGVFLDLGSAEDGFVFLGRPAVETQITWSGSEEKMRASSHRAIERLTPSGSFTLWREISRGHSAAFDEVHHDQAATVLRGLVSLRSRESRRIAERQRRRAEREKVRLQRELLSASRTTSLNELGAAVAHELNQPLTATMNFISASRRLLSRRPGEAGKALALLDDAAEQAKRAGSILRQVRGLIERGEVDQVEIDLADLVRVAVDTALTQDAEQALDIDFDIPEKLPTVLGDRVQLEQLVFNLIKNAVEAMSDSSVKRLHVAIAPRAGEMEVRVKDSGPGVAPEIAQQLFKPFNTSKVNGMGIGLSLCRTIVEAHGGKITAESTTGGALFSFTLPIEAGD